MQIAAADQTVVMEELPFAVQRRLSYRAHPAYDPHINIILSFLNKQEQLIWY